ncbi:methionine gamma-lyase family protein [Acidaminobacter sp. JC074]|uniref:methionine gamma-lyase family protein n=1 Tax=Acidaminobacter sp. JC074 TaxID=2530199 RepID=UPI001F0E48C7|nr:methionine gamma-lyase family protein [Acidaminobacter sp. JC074]
MYESLGIHTHVLDYLESVESDIKETFDEIDEIASYNQLKVLNAMQKHRLSSNHFNWHTGYGYDDPGRDKIEEIYADVFKTEDAIVRPIIVNGTHALSLCLSGILKTGDTLLSIAGKPYDTLDEVIGISNEYNQALDINYLQVDLTSDGEFQFDLIKENMKSPVKMIYIQRSSGYAWRQSLTIDKIKEVIAFVKDIQEDVIVMIDNCYGEFLDYQEPTEVGADIMAGSLIKNPGGGLAIAGGYIVGKKDLVEQVSYRMTTPGIGKECGLMFGQTRTMFHGLFIAPQTVAGAIKGAIYCSRAYEKLGFEVNPRYDDPRSDIIQSVKLGTKNRVIAFCEGVQYAAPVDSHVTPVPWAMPGYDSDVIMAAGAFVQGSSIELSADAPMREPFIVYFQGGVTYDHSKFGVMQSLNRLYEKELVDIK